MQGERERGREEGRKEQLYKDVYVHGNVIPLILDASTQSITI